MPNLHNIDSCPEHWKQHKNMGVLGFAIYIAIKPIQKRSLRIEEPLFKVEKFVIKESKEGMISRRCYRWGIDGLPVLRI
ncbi:MAG TPA: hypothetical protein VKA87_00265 [Nitrososphaeraceae archaeon]|nr:hypothetical protein [Nitrososphaeraceae archaeon]